MRGLLNASEVPRLYYLKGRLLSPQRLADLARSADLDELARLLRDTRYQECLHGAQGARGMADALTRCALRDKLFIHRIADPDARIVTGELLRAEDARNIVMIIKRYVVEGPRGIGELDEGTLHGESLELYRLLLEQPVESREQQASAPLLLKRVSDSLADKALKRDLREAQKLYESEQDLGVVEAYVASRRLADVVSAASRVENRTGPSPRDIVCPYVDYLFAQMLANLFMHTRNPNVVANIAIPRATCRLKDVISAVLASASPLQLYQALQAKYRLPAKKFDNEADADETVGAQVAALVLQRARRAMLSYPFTPSLPIALYMAVEMELQALTRILSLKQLGAPLERYSHLIPVA